MGTPGGKGRLGNPRRKWRVILKWIFRNWGWGEMDWFDLAAGGDRWWAIVNEVMVMRLRVP